MKTDFHTYFHLLKSKTNNKGLAPIYLRLTVDLKRLKYSITRRVEPKRWSQKSQRALGTNREAVEINTHIDNIKHKLNKIHQKLIDNDELITASSMMNLLKGGGKKTRFILEIFKEHNERTDLLTDKDISVSTAKRYWTCYDHVKQFIEEEYRLHHFGYNLIFVYLLYRKSTKHANIRNIRLFK